MALRVGSVSCTRSAIATFVHAGQLDGPQAVGGAILLAVQGMTQAILFGARDA